MKHLVLLSGGLDSACLLSWLQYGKKVDNLEAMFIDYGQKNKDAEYDAARRICAFNVIELKYVNAKDIFYPIQCSILAEAQGEHTVLNDELPNRNAVLINIAAAHIPKDEEAIIYVAAHKTPAPYADAKPKFYTLMNKALRYSTNNRVSVKAPFINIPKIEVAKKGKQTGMSKAEFMATVSCYEGNACGKCPACIQREKVIKEIFRY